MLVFCESKVAITWTLKKWGIFITKGWHHWDICCLFKKKYGIRQSQLHNINALACHRDNSFDLILMLTKWLLQFQTPQSNESFFQKPRSRQLAWVMNEYSYILYPLFPIKGDVLERKISIQKVHRTLSYLALTSTGLHSVLEQVRLSFGVC